MNAVAEKKAYDRRRYLEKREQILAATKAYRDSHRDYYRDYQVVWQQANRDKARAYSQKWRDKDPEHSTALRKAHYVENRDRNLAIAREWAAANPEKVREHGRRKAAKRRAVLVGVPTLHITDKEWARLCNRHGNRCAYCGEVRPLTMDHVIPITRGGQHAIGNLAPACLSCNSSKGSQLLVEWRNRKVA